MKQLNQLSGSYNHQNDQHYLVEHDRKLKCICQLCTCGKHHCPRKPIRTDFQTSYSRQFKKFPNLIPVDQRLPYRYEERHYSNDVMKTNYQENYEKQVSFAQQGPLPNSRFEQVGKSVLAPQVPFVGVSSYNEQYQPYKMMKKSEQQNPQAQFLSPVKSSVYRKPNAKFQGISSYKSTFLPPPQPRKIQNKYPGYRKPQVPFYGVSSYTDQYKPIEIQPHKQLYVDETYKSTRPVKFQGKSAYKEQFQPYQIQNINSYSRLSNLKSDCKLDQVIVPSINYINSNEHVYYDPELKKFY